RAPGPRRAGARVPANPAALALCWRNWRAQTAGWAAFAAHQTLLGQPNAAMVSCTDGAGGAPPLEGVQGAPGKALALVARKRIFLTRARRRGACLFPLLLPRGDAAALQVGAHAGRDPAVRRLAGALRARPARARGRALDRVHGLRPGNALHCRPAAAARLQ